jgi:hypothetical protein
MVLTPVRYKRSATTKIDARVKAVVIAERASGLWTDDMNQNHVTVPGRTIREKNV